MRDGKRVRIMVAHGIRGLKARRGEAVGEEAMHFDVFALEFANYHDMHVLLLCSNPMK